MRADGIAIRPVRPTELDQVLGLLADRFSSEDAQDVELVAADPAEGLSQIGVAVDGDRVVATATLLGESLQVGQVRLPAGQVELVATAQSHERRGLVRDLMTWAHGRSAGRGDLVQLMSGIPYFYRQFGYSYCLPVALPREVAGAATPSQGITVRAAIEADVADMDRLQGEVQADFDVVAPHSASCWRWLVARDGSTQLVAEMNASIVATARMVGPDDGEVILAEVAGSSEGVGALECFARDAGEGELSIVERPGAPWAEAYAARLEPVDRAEGVRDWYSIRIPNLAPLLFALGPVFSDRLAKAGRGTHTGSLLLSSWGSHVVMQFESGDLARVESGGVEQAPVSKGGAGIPPDALGPLLFGPFGAAVIEERFADCLLGSQAALLQVLFPPVSSDLLSFYLPV